LRQSLIKTKRKRFKAGCWGDCVVVAGPTKRISRDRTDSHAIRASWENSAHGAVLLLALGTGIKRHSAPSGGFNYQARLAVKRSSFRNSFRLSSWRRALFTEISVT
jgi:hypothetical protein